MINDPWTTLSPPTAQGTVSAKRVDSKNPWEFFWAVSPDNRCLLVMNHAAASTPAGHLPNLRGIDVLLTEPIFGERSLLLKLLDSKHRDIFHRLCLDVVGSTADAPSEREAVQTALSRTWRWHHLLRGGADGRLSLEEQEGLIGELLVLERVLLVILSPIGAVKAWRGPSGAPKDFEVGRLAIEAKARRGAATPFVAISSEHQLDTAGTSGLYLHVVDLSTAPGDAPSGFAVSDVAERVRAIFDPGSGEASAVFEEHLAAAGFRWDDDYSENRWVEGDTRVYLVDDGFPAITPASLSSGVSHVRYAVSLPACEAFRVTEHDLRKAVEDSNAH